MHIYTYTCRIPIDAIIKTSEDFFKKYTSHFIERVVCERELETEQNCNILTPTLMAISVVSFAFSRAAQLEARGPTPLGAGFLYHILSPTGLVSKLTQTSCAELYYCFMPTQSILMASQAGICHFRHLWTGMFDHLQVEITVMQFRGHPLPVHQFLTVLWDFNPVPYYQPSSPTQSLVRVRCQYTTTHHSISPGPN